MLLSKSRKGWNHCRKKNNLPMSRNPIGMKHNIFELIILSFVFRFLLSQKKNRGTKVTMFIGQQKWKRNTKDSLCELRRYYITTKGAKNAKFFNSVIIHFTKMNHDFLIIFKKKRNESIMRHSFFVICMYEIYFVESVIKGINISSIEIPPCWKVFL